MDENTIHRLKNIFSKPRSVLVAAAILFLPLLFIGTHNSHDWGDDFAQYIHQAGNIVQGIPQSETGYVYNEMNPSIGPQAYPMGFPLLLAPVYKLAGNSIGAFIILISLLYIVLGLLMIVFYRQYFSWITALVLAMIFMYNPSLVIFKSEVMSDIPFTALLVLNFILYQKSKPGNLKQYFILALSTGLMLAVRPAGIVFIGAVMMEQLFFLVRRETLLKDFAIHGGMIILVPVLIYYVINIYIFRIPSGGSLHDYLIFYQPGNLINTIPENLSRYIEEFRYMYVPQSGAFSGISLLLGSIMITMTLIGFIKRMIKKPEVTEWFFLFYTFMLLGYHYNNSSFRLIVPLGFISLFYATTGFKSVQLLTQISSRKKALAIGILIVLLYMPALLNIARSSGGTLEGPQQKSAIETFNYIKKNVPAEAVVVFAKPRALALYGGCRSMADPRASDPTLVHKQVMDARASYLLISDKLTNEVTQRYTRVMQSRLTKKFENKDFVLYKINPVNP